MSDFGPATAATTVAGQAATLRLLNEQATALLRMGRTAEAIAVLESLDQLGCSSPRRGVALGSALRARPAAPLLV